jgi:hypothetical protein
MFRSLPQDEPFSFVPHSPRDELDEGEAMRTARLFDALEGIDARVIAQHTLFEGLDDWGYLTVVTMTPARLFELSEELDELQRGLAAERSVRDVEGAGNAEV